MRAVGKSVVFATVVALIAVVGGAAYLRADRMTSVSLDTRSGLQICARDEQIPAEERKAIEAAAQSYVRRLLAGDVDAAYAGLSPDTRAGVTRQDFAKAVQQVVAGRYNPELKVVRTYRLNGFGGSGGQVMCGAFSQPDQWDLIRVGRANKQAHVQITAPQVNGSGAFEIWMQSEGGRWTVSGFHHGPLTLSGRDFRSVWKAAQEQRRKHNDYNAALLYAAADGLLDRGPDFRPGARDPFDKDRSSFRPVSDLLGTKQWWFGDRTFDVRGVTVMGVEGGKLALVVEYDMPDWQDDKAADRRNRELIEAFTKVHPEWSEVFDYISARAWAPTGASFGTVYDKSAGYLAHG